MQNFQQILTQAAQLKQHQLKKERKGYQSLPQFIKSGLGYNKKYQLIRKQHFLYQMRISGKVKQQGNALFKQNKYEQALSKYQQALSVFRYIQSQTYQNMRDQHLTYHTYNVNDLQEQYRNQFQIHMVALYLNICSCLTKLNKKQDAIYSADEALKIRKTAKAHYRKAHAYLKYVNREISDIKLGLLQLKQAYAIEKDPGILNQMYATKQSYQKEQQKSKNWFKFMFDKNKNASEQNNQKKKENIQEPLKQKKTKQLNPQKQKVTKKINQLQKQVKKSINPNEKQKIEQIKQKLQVYISLQQSSWLYLYQKDFIKRHGSKIYSLLKIYNHESQASQFRNKLANCLQSQDNYEKNKRRCQQCIEWLQKNKIQQIAKYQQRYELQTNWIKQRRKKVVDQMQMQFQTINKEQNSKSKVYQQKQQQVIHKQEIKNQKQHNKQQQQFYVRKQYDIIQKEPNIYQQNTTSFKQQPKSQYKKKQGMDSLRRQLQQQFKQQQKQKNQLQLKKSKQLKQKYIVVAVVLILLLIRFLWN